MGWELFQPRKTAGRAGAMPGVVSPNPARDIETVEKTIAPGRLWRAPTPTTKRRPQPYQTLSTSRTSTVLKEHQPGEIITMMMTSETAT